MHKQEFYNILLLYVIFSENDYEVKTEGKISQANTYLKCSSERKTVTNIMGKNIRNRFKYIKTV